MSTVPGPEGHRSTVVRWGPGPARCAFPGGNGPEKQACAGWKPHRPGAKASCVQPREAPARKAGAGRPNSSRAPGCFGDTSYENPACKGVSGRSPPKTAGCGAPVTAPAFFAHAPLPALRASLVLARGHPKANPRAIRAAGTKECVRMPRPKRPPAPEPRKAIEKEIRRAIKAFVVRRERGLTPRQRRRGVRQ